MRLHVMLIVLATVLAMSAAGLMSASVAHGQNETVLVIAQQSDPGVLNEMMSDTLGGLFVHQNVYQTLVNLGYDGQSIIPVLAKSWTISPDGLNYTFHLRPGLKWQDGTPFTADDVKFTMDTTVSLPSWAVAYLFSVDHTVVNDAYNITFVLKSPDAGFLALFAFGSNWGLNILPKHLYAGTNISTNQYNQAPVGLGPYKFVDHTAGQSITLAANPDYWGGKPAVDKVVIKVIPQPATALQELQSGDVQYVTTSDNPVAFSQIPPMANISNIALSRPLNGVLTWFLYNTKDSVLQNATLRQAIGYAINRTELAQKAYYGYALGMNGFYLEGKWFNAAAELAYNPAKATQLLDQLGYPQGTCRLTLEFAFHPLYGMDVEAQVAKEQLSKVGICLTLWSGDYATWFAKVHVDGNYQLALRASMVGPEPSMMWPWLDPTHSGESGSTFFNNTAMNNLFAQAKATTDAPQRKALYDQVQQILHDYVPVLPLTAIQDVNLWRSDLVRNLGPEVGTNRWDLSKAEVISSAAPAALNPYLIAAAVIIVVAAVGGIVWLRVRKSRARKAKKPEEPSHEEQPPQGGPPGAQ